MDDQKINQKAECQLFTVAEFVQLSEFRYLTESGMRHLIFNSRPRYSASGDLIPGNGLVESGAIVRLGKKKILISVPEFREWVLSQRETLASA